jgi:ArsR family transcriptional regulator
MIRVRAHYAQMNALLAYLTENCCGGATSCAPASTCTPTRARTEGVAS